MTEQPLAVVLAMCLGLWAIVSLGLVAVQDALIKRGAMDLPGGGRTGLIVRSMLWPLIVVFLVIGLVIVVFD